MSRFCFRLIIHLFTYFISLSLVAVCMLFLVNIFTVSVLVSVFRTVGNYMLWRIVMNRVNNMPQKYLDVRREFSKVRPLRMFSFEISFQLESPICLTILRHR